MQQEEKTPLKLILSLMLIAVVTLSSAWFYDRSNPPKSELSVVKAETNNQTDKIDKKAKKILMDMSLRLKALDQFSFQSRGYFEVIDSLGKKDQMNNSGELFVKRPDKIKVQRTGEKSDLEFYCDGKQVTLYGKNLNYYSSAPAKSDLNSTFEEISENLGIYLPASDLLYTDVYEGLMQDVVAGKYSGKEKVENVKCDHLCFEGKEVDWQIWVDEEKKLPMKYVITSKMIEGKPEACIEILKWDTDINLEDKMFVFTPPNGAEKIDFLKQTDIQAKQKTK